MRDRVFEQGRERGEGDINTQARSPSDFFAKRGFRRNALDARYKVAIELDREFLDRSGTRRTFASYVPLRKYLFDMNLDELIGRNQVQSNTPAKIRLKPVIVQLRPRVPKTEDERLAALADNEKGGRRLADEGESGRVL